MRQVRATAVRWVNDEPIPGWVEVHLALADGTVAKLFDKPPMFESDDRRLRPNAKYPVTLSLDCEIVADDRSMQASSGSLYIILAHGISDLSGRITFCVHRESVTASA
jgi:hypothetical protein